MKSCNSFPQLKLHKGITSQVPYIAYPWCPLMSTDVQFQRQFHRVQEQERALQALEVGSLDVVGCRCCKRCKMSCHLKRLAFKTICAVQTGRRCGDGLF